jgi:hypothetical protein
MSLTRRNLFQDKTRLALSIGGVGLAVTLILILKGFLAGMNRQITSYLDHSPGTIVVAELNKKQKTSVAWIKLFLYFHNSSFSIYMKRNNLLT